MTDFTTPRFFAFAVMATVMIQPVAAVATMISDNYVGSDSHGYGDVIGRTADFQISGMDVSLSGSMLNVSIYTSFAGKGDDGLFASLSGGNGVGYGDLFLSNAWNPAGPAPYTADDSSNGTLWTYGFALDNRWWNGADATGGTGTLYQLNGATNDVNALLSEDFLTDGIFRNGQEVAVDTNGQTSVGSGSWSIIDGSQINFVLDLTGTSLLNGDEIALHWGFTCANDVIEGAYSVSEPGIALLLATGLIVIGLGYHSNRASQHRFAQPNNPDPDD